MATIARAPPPAATTILLGDALDPYPAGEPPAQAETGSTPTGEGASKDPAADLKAGTVAGDCPGGYPGRDGEHPVPHPPLALQQFFTLIGIKFFVVVYVYINFFVKKT
jgi:hypothetical protein